MHPGVSNPMFAAYTEHDGTVTPTIAVIQLTTSFEHIWSRLADSAGARAVRHDNFADADATSAELIVIAAGGAEADAAEVVRSLHRRAVMAPIVVAGSLRDHRLAASVVRAGADDYFALPGDMEELAAWLTSRAEAIRSALPESNAVEQPRFDFSRIIGESPALRATLDLASRIIPHADANVLVTGETGTGKELVAQAIHYNGPRAHQPFVDINCSALPGNLVETELFGYEAGAFTDARTAKPGLLEIANGGTVFLDEIAELPLELQAKLLRVLDDRRVRRLGATQATRIDVRVIAATHADLASAVTEHRFRQDLYYRLNVFSVHLPPLRDRGNDVIILAEHFARDIAARCRGARFRIDDATRQLLLRHSWPGNIRELRNAIERAIALGNSLMLPGEMNSESGQRAGTLPFPADMEAIQQAAARAMVTRHRGNKSAAAASLGISRKRLYSLLHAPAAMAPTAGSTMPARTSPFVQERPRTTEIRARDVQRSLWRVQPMD